MKQKVNAPASLKKAIFSYISYKPNRHNISEHLIISALEKKVREKSREYHNHAADLPRHQEEEETGKIKHAQIEQTYEQH